MGMAASQARLLCITARIHDVEYQAQSILNAKMQLSNLSDKAYQEYNAALDATTLTINTINVDNGEKSTVPATFNNLCSRNKLTIANGKDYAIRNSKGLLLVEDDIEEAYYAFKTKGLDDPYQFAAYMCGLDVKENLSLNRKRLEDAELAIYNDNQNEKLTELYKKLSEFSDEGIYKREIVGKINFCKF